MKLNDIFFSRKQQDIGTSVIPEEYQDKMIAQNMRKMHIQDETSLDRETENIKTIVK